jgi:hypothetical protein
VGASVLVAGGWGDGLFASARALLLNIDTRQAPAVGPLVTARAHFRMASLGGKMFAIGGFAEHVANVLGSVEKWDGVNKA